MNQIVKEDSQRQTSRALACIVLAAGEGTRMSSDRPKVMHELACRPMLGWLLETVEFLGPDQVIVVIGLGMPELEAFASSYKTVVQENRKGTADAVKIAMGSLESFDGDVMVLYGDGPLYRAETLSALHRTLENHEMTFLAMRPEDPTGYGRMLCDEQGHVTRIVEEKDATEEERTVGLCWTGVMCARKDSLVAWLPEIGNDNAKGEYYLTDLPAIAAADGRRTAVAESPFEETLGANTRSELAALEQKVQSRLRQKMMEGGVTFLDPETVYLSWDTQIGQDSVIEPNVFFGPGVQIGEGVYIKAFSHIEGAHIEDSSIIGPFARLRPGTVIGPRVKVGNFVEIKNSTLDVGVRANHLSYIGDATVGADTNIGCGAITVNFDGTEKHRTVIGSGAMVGSNTNLIAPVEIGDGAFIAAGSTVSKNVAPGALAVERGAVKIREGWAWGEAADKPLKNTGS